MSFNRESSLLLADEIDSSGEDLSLFIRIVQSASPGKAAKEIAYAEVDLWVMIEDSCSIVRQVRLPNKFIYAQELTLHRSLRVTAI